MVKGKRKIAVLDFGGQYAHLIASRLRRLGAYSEIVHAEDVQAATVSLQYSGIIYSGGPSSVYEEGAPTCDPAVLSAGIPVFGICYGHQLMMHQAGGRVRTAQGHGQEFGPAFLSIHEAVGILSSESLSEKHTVWMNHGDEVTELPPGFRVLGSTDDCAFAAVGDPDRNLYGVQFHPEVADTVHGDQILMSFIRICGLENSWRLEDFLKAEIDRVAEEARDKRILFLLSGGVDSTVAFALLSRVVPADRLKGLFIDTGFMRAREMEEVRDALAGQGMKPEIRDASALFFSKLAGVSDPEKKRRIIGELFIDVQEEVTAELGLESGGWLLGQGTIYPDRIESGGTKKSHKIKTHHNRVSRIQEMLEKGLVIEPLMDLYKDEVRRLGTLLGLPDELVHRHPFPGPGLAVRCLCTSPEENLQTEMFPSSSSADGDAQIMRDLEKSGLTARILPLHSVGVQGDQRSYARPAAVFASGSRPSWPVFQDLARRIPNRFRIANRVVFCLQSRTHSLEYKVKRGAFLVPERIRVLQEADRIVRQFQTEKQIVSAIWQFPVILLPISSGKVDDESIMLRPIVSVDAMTATAYRMEDALMDELANRLIQIPEIDSVFYDLTSKPPGTIEWE